MKNRALVLALAMLLPTIAFAQSNCVIVQAHLQNDEKDWFTDHKAIAYELREWLVKGYRSDSEVYISSAYNTAAAHGIEQNGAHCSPVYATGVYNPVNMGSGNNYFQQTAWDQEVDHTGIVGATYYCINGTPHQATTYVPAQACGSGCQCGNITPTACKPCPTSPIIIDVTGKGFFLTSNADGVDFDMAGDGTKVHTSWTAAGNNNGFLTLPSADGLIHNGKNLFGNQIFANGFVDLAHFDQPEFGGNNDGEISAADAIYASLRVWIDLNHDGVSEPEELHTLAELGIRSISLKYKERDLADRYGNIFKYEGSLKGLPDQKIWDAYFILSDPSSAANCPLVPKRTSPAPEGWSTGR